VIRVKICGITREEDAWVAVEGGADALGFVFYPKSPRAISPERAGEISRRLPPFLTRVGVFVDEPPERVSQVFERAALDAVQLHGSEPAESMAQYPGKVIKAFRIRGPESLEALPHYPVGAYLLDAYRKGVPGGTGETFDWDLAVRAKKYGKVILSGGLTPDNVAEAIQAVQPYAVDVSSGIEAEPGVKDPERLKRFFQQVRSASAA